MDKNPKIIIRSKMPRYMQRLPHKVIINGQPVCILQQPEATLSLPPGKYLFTLQSAIPFLSASTYISLQYQQQCAIEFSDREHLWDILFGIDIILSIVHLFVDFPQPFDTIYTILTNAFFVIWLVYEWRIRSKYFALSTHYCFPPLQSNNTQK